MFVVTSVTLYGCYQVSLVYCFFVPIRVSACLVNYLLDRLLFCCCCCSSSSSYAYNLRFRLYVACFEFAYIRYVIYLFGCFYASLFNWVP